MAAAATRIVDQAERLFRHYGYAKTNVADIARELGMSPANVYRVFPSKLAIYVALIERILAGMEAMLGVISERPACASERLRACVISQHQTAVARMRMEPKVHEMVRAAFDGHWPVVEHYLARITHILAAIVSDGIAAGEFPAQDVERATRCFRTAVTSVCHPSVVALSCERTDPRDIAEFALQGLRNPPDTMTAVTCRRSFGRQASTEAPVSTSKAPRLSSGVDRASG